jgi:hypothetical protein
MWAALAKGRKALPFSGGVQKSRGEPPVGGLAGNFLFAGSSACLLVVANLFPHYWYLSFFALTPFLWRIIRLDALGALQLGLFLVSVSFPSGNFQTF